MRSLIIALGFAAGFALAGASPTLASPSGMKALGDYARAEGTVEEARWRRRCRHWRHSRRTCWRRWW